MSVNTHDSWSAHSLSKHGEMSKVIQSVRKISVGSRSVLGRQLVVGYGLQTLPNVLRVVGGEILLKLVTVFGLAGLDGLFRCISRRAVSKHLLPDNVITFA